MHKKGAEASEPSNVRFGLWLLTLDGNSPADDRQVSMFAWEVIVRKGDRTEMTEYASRRTIEVINERFSQSHGRLSLIGISSKIDQEFQKHCISNRNISKHIRQQK